MGSTTFRSNIQKLVSKSTKNRILILTRQELKYFCKMEIPTRVTIYYKCRSRVLNSSLGKSLAPKLLTLCDSYPT